jgi:glycosyltransferase involved in cell wall biosynthesis
MSSWHVANPPLRKVFMPPDLLAALLDLQPDAARTQARIILAPPAPVAAPAAVPAGGSALLRPVSALARLVLRSPRIKKLALRWLARAPALHAKALSIMFPASKVIALDAVPLDPAVAATLSPRARLAARRLHVRAPACGPVPARPRLAFVSPLPPARTGIADYAAQLLPALMEHFEIVLVVQQDSLTLPPELAALPVRDPAWLHAHAHEVDQILYQIGNSEFHSHMFALLRDLPGVVVLHDFFLGNVMAYRQMRQDPPGAWTGALFHAHGFPALRAYQQAPERTALFKVYPCNLAVLEQASAVIHHSTHAANLARAWYGEHATRNWHSVPLPRAAPPTLDRGAARSALGIADDVFLVCSFGYVMPNKLGERLLAAWLESSLHAGRRCLLVLVGELQDSPFGARIARLVETAQGSVRIAGWSDDALYRQYLQAADLGVQLRTSAQGETSAAVLDCMNYGLATIVNANGSMADLPDDTVLRLPDAFDDAALTAALETLYRDDIGRRDLGRRAARLLATEYRPEHGAARYAAALHQARQPQPEEWHVRQLLVDIGAADPGELLALLAESAVRVEAVRLVLEDGHWRLRYARQHVAGLLGLTWAVPDDPLADLARGDILYCPGATGATDAASRAGLWADLRERGVVLAFGWEDAGADLVVGRAATRN